MDLEFDSPAAQELRSRLVQHLVELGDLREPRVKEALLRVLRHRFVGQAVPLDDAYANGPIDIGHGQTISQPSVVAVMTEALELAGTERVLEIGTGSGYQAAVLAELAARVFTIEIISELAQRAAQRLAELGYANVEVRVGDGSAGWPEHAPFDRILVTAAAPTIPDALLAQLADGGILVAPVGGTSSQSLRRFRKRAGHTTSENLGPVAFVPMTRSRTPGLRHDRKRPWNVVITLAGTDFRKGVRLLDDYERVHRTRYYNVLLANAADPRALLERLQARKAADPEACTAISSVVPVGSTFEFRSDAEREAKVREALAALAPALAGRSFHVRVHHRGAPGLSSRDEERDLDRFLLEALERAGTPGRIAFDQADAILTVEVVGPSAGVSAWTREELDRHPLLHLD
ncbi:MAG TPA: protein-L-isoaspartate(D-aspartate) O-methyltransferase [Polyangiaceae bacterium]|nr:protein-L-isoaspartate(D-aspartate) O-methyltransferase [Polyangiaceae bacterium]